MALWSSARELMRGGGELPSEGRRSGLSWDAIRESINRPDMNSLERRQLFEVIAAPCKPEEFRTQFAALAELTNHGKDVATFESDIVPLIAGWLRCWFKAAAAARKIQKDREKEKNVKALPDGSTFFRCDASATLFRSRPRMCLGLSVPIGLAHGSLVSGELGCFELVLDRLAWCCHKSTLTPA